MFSCFVCGKYATSGCGSCKRIAYCGDECQNTHWYDGHNQECSVESPMIGGSITNLAQALDPYSVMNILSKLPDDGILSLIQDTDDGPSAETVEYLSQPVFKNFWNDRYDQLNSQFYPKSETTAFGVWYKTALLRNYTSSINWADFPTNTREKTLVIPVDLKSFLFALPRIFRALQKSFPKYFDEAFFDALEKELRPLKLAAVKDDEERPNYSIIIPIWSDLWQFSSVILFYLQNEKTRQRVADFADITESPASQGEDVFLAWPDDIFRKFVEIVVEMPKAYTSNARRLENDKQVRLSNQDREVMKKLFSFKLPAYQ